MFDFSSLPTAPAIPFKEPTAEDLHLSCLKSYECTSAFMIDHWPTEVVKLSFPTKMIEIDAGEAYQLFGDDWRPIADKIAAKLDEEMDWHQYFIRLNSRSPKDAIERPVTCSGRQALMWIMTSERCLDDITVAYHAKKPVFICLREVRHLHKDAEFRCFAKNGEVIAVSRYFYQDEPEYRAEPGTMMEAAKAFYEKHLKQHYDNVVFDLYAPGTSQEILIELNPYGMSDPCLFGSYDEVEKGGERL
jgi:hypothetical protein